MAGILLCNLPFILDNYRSSQSLKIVGLMFGMCIYPVIYLCKQTNKNYLL